MPDTWHSKLYDNRLDVVNDFLSKKKSLGRSERTLKSTAACLNDSFTTFFRNNRLGKSRPGTSKSM